MLFDDVHKAKWAHHNVKPSQQGSSVMRLQYNYPRARVVYSSATTASEVEHLQVLSRLNMWEPNTAYENKEKFRKTLAKR